MQNKIDCQIKHLAIIMDGNVRWAEKQGKSEPYGHEHGAENAKKILSHALKRGIKYLTLYTFSSENWLRPQEEINTLFSLLSDYINSETEAMIKNKIRFKVVGNFDRLPKELVEKINKLSEQTKECDKMTLTLAFSYGAREEIASACQKAINSGIKQIDEHSLKQFMYDPDMPDVDAMLRTSGVHRISNFLLWQISYAEIYFIDKYWPDFSEEDLDQLIEHHTKVKKNFGRRA